MRSKQSRRRFLALPVVLALTVAMAPAANAQDDSWIDEYLLSGSSDPFFVGGEYSWGLQEIRPMQDPGVYPVTVTFVWGDGEETAASTETQDIWCWDENEGAELPDPSWRCGTWVGHEYEQQGLYTITATAEQLGSENCQASADAAVIDLALGGSVRGSGTLEARSGGMYDQEFVTGEASFTINAKRRDGKSATTVALSVSVPSMVADYPDNTTVTGMTFTSKAATRPLYVEPLGGRGNYEVFIERIYGSVTNTIGYTGSASATFHAKVVKGQPTLVRISISNTSMGFTYVDTAVAGQGWLQLASTDSLTSGLVRVS